MPDLNSSRIRDTYQGLIQVPGDISAGPVRAELGDGRQLPFSVSSDRLAVAGELGATSSVLSRLADGAVSGGRGVLETAAGVAYCDAATTGHAGRLVGVTLNAAASGGDVRVLPAGPVVEPSWAWTPNAPVFLGSAGALTQTPPTTGFSQVVGTALSLTKLLVNIQPPVVL